MKWKYDLKSCGKELRQCINNDQCDCESCLNTLLALENCYKLIQTILTENDWDEINAEYECVKEHIASFDGVDKKDMKLLYLQDIVDVVNDDLSVFYDICDDYSIWIGV